MPVASSFHTNAWNTSNKSLAIYSNICLTVSSSQILLFTCTAMLLQICVCVCMCVLVSVRGIDSQQWGVGAMLWDTDKLYFMEAKMHFEVL